jgi:hypothetical protein
MNPRLHDAEQLAAGALAETQVGATVSTTFASSEQLADAGFVMAR